MFVSGLMNHTYEMFLTIRRVADPPRAILLEWMALPDDLVAAKTAQKIFTEVES